MVELGFVTSDNLQQEALASIVVCRKRSVLFAFLIFLGVSDNICGTKRAQTLAIAKHINYCHDTSFTSI